MSTTFQVFFAAFLIFFTHVLTPVSYVALPALTSFPHLFWFFLHPFATPLHASPLHVLPSPSLSIVDVPPASLFPTHHALLFLVDAVFPALTIPANDGRLLVAPPLSKAACALSLTPLTLPTDWEWAGSNIPKLHDIQLFHHHPFSLSLRFL